MLTRELLTQVLKRLFGVVTVRVSFFGGRGARGSVYPRPTSRATA